MSDIKDAPLLVRLSNAALTDKELLIISDALFLALSVGKDTEDKAIEYVTRHKEAVKMLNAAVFGALNQRDIDYETATKRVTTVVDLLA